MSSPLATIILGIDPGKEGGFALLGPLERVQLRKTPDTERDLVDYLASCGAAFAVLERQDPRPTHWRDKLTGQLKTSVLPSTVKLYGRYALIKGALAALRIPFDDVLPRAWQKGLGITNAKGSRLFKRALRQRAEQLFPKAKGLTMKTCDALLLAEYGRRLYAGSVPRPAGPQFRSSDDLSLRTPLLIPEGLGTYKRSEIGLELDHDLPENDP